MAAVRQRRRFPSHVLAEGEAVKGGEGDHQAAERVSLKIKGTIQFYLVFH